ncbi:MAG: hypothetical protein GWP70_01520 [Proteobacteria bacterium]|nr:hypothetical protein [Pseudomonadota bacterium]
MSKWSVAKETVTALSAQASDHGADAAGMLEALISTALTALATEKDAAYIKNFIDYEVASINVQHVDVQRLT